MIDKLKAEIFDLIVEQDKLRTKFTELEKQKQAKLKELECIKSENSKSS